MKVKVFRNGNEIEVEETEILASDKRLTDLQSLPEIGDTAATQALLDAQKVAEKRKQTADESLRALRLQTCRTLLKVSLGERQAARCPSRSASNAGSCPMVDKGQPFEPAELENCHPGRAEYAQSA